MPPQCFDIHRFFPFSLFSIRFASTGSTPMSSYLKLRGRLPFTPSRLAASRLALLSLYNT